MSSLAVLSFACSRSRTRRRGVRFLLAARCLPRRQALDGRPWLPLGQWQLRCFLDGHACLESGWGCCSAVLLPNDVASLRAVASLPVAGFSFPYLFFLLFLIFFSIFSPSGDQRLMSSIPGFDVARLPPSSHQRANGLALAADSVRGLPTRPTKHCKPALEPRRLPALV